MEKDPHQAQPHSNLNPEMEQIARRQIEAALDRLDFAHPVIDTLTARVIAASIHSGPGSLLEHFAATGRLNPHQVMEEVSDALLAGSPQDWASALAYYVEDVVTPNKDRRPTDFVEPLPEAFVESDATHTQAWRLLNEPDLLGDWLVSPIRIRNAVGFHGIDVRAITEPSELVALARAVAEHGEALAAFTDVFGFSPLASGRFRRRYVGSFYHLSEFLAAFAESYGLLGPDAQTGARVRGPTINVRLLERGLSETYVWAQGRSQVHVFARSPTVRPDFPTIPIYQF